MKRTIAQTLVALLLTAGGLLGLATLGFPGFAPQTSGGHHHRVAARSHVRRLEIRELKHQERAGLHEVLVFGSTRA